MHTRIHWGGGGFKRAIFAVRCFVFILLLSSSSSVQSLLFIIVAINGGWCPWSEWSKCSITCGEGGYQTRSRTCDKPSPDYGGKLCKGDALQAQVCSGQPCGR